MPPLASVAALNREKRVFPTKTPTTPLFRWGRTAGKPNIFEANRQLADRYDCHEKSVRNILKRAGEAEKENIDSFSSEAHQQRPRPERPIAIKYTYSATAYQTCYEDKISTVQVMDHSCTRDWVHCILISD